MVQHLEIAFITLSVPKKLSGTKGNMSEDRYVDFDAFVAAIVGKCKKLKQIMGSCRGMPHTSLGSSRRLPLTETALCHSTTLQTLQIYDIDSPSGLRQASDIVRCIHQLERLEIK